MNQGVLAAFLYTSERTCPPSIPWQFGGWLTEVNTVRPCRATREIPAVRLPAEQARLKPLAVAPAAYGLRFPITVGPTAMVTYQGIRYAMPAAAGPDRRPHGAAHQPDS